MTLQALLPLVTYPDAHQEVAVENAAAIARLMGANMHALALRVDIPSVSNALSRALMDLPEMIRRAERQSTDAASSLLEAARSKAAAGFDVTTESLIGQPVQIADLVARQARYFDIALVGVNAQNPSTATLAEAILFGSGRPLMAFPETQKAPSQIDHVVVAWDGSRVAARALADAAPFIHKARIVSIVSVTDEKALEDRDSGDVLASRLRQGGINASYSPVRAAGKPIATSLQEYAADQDGQLLVMGGFGHSRLRDFVLGGATAGVLSDLRMPILLSH